MTVSEAARLRTLEDENRRLKKLMANIVDASLSGQRVVRELALIAECRGLPCMVVSDRGAERTNYAVLAWCQDTGVE